MSITIRVGICTEDPRKLDKRPNFEASTPTEITVDVKANCSIMRPDLIVATTNVNLVTCNYLQIPSWGRYYYIRDLVTMPGAQTMIRADEDVLTSNADAIKNIVGTVGRQESAAMREKYLFDPKMLRKSKIYTETIPFSKNVFSMWDGAFFDQVHYVLAVVGGDGSSS